MSAGYRVTYHDGVASELLRLPMAAAPGAVPDKAVFLRYAPLWAIPACSTYLDGCAAGDAAAFAYMRGLAAVGNKGTSSGWLQKLVFALFERLAAASTEQERSGLHGQIVGFFTTVEAYTAHAADRCAGSLLAITEESICRDLQDAIDGGPMARYELSIKKARSEAARSAARKRWDKRSAVDTPGQAAAAR